MRMFNTITDAVVSRQPLRFSVITWIWRTSVHQIKVFLAGLRFFPSNGHCNLPNTSSELHCFTWFRSVRFHYTRFSKFCKVFALCRLYGTSTIECIYIHATCTMNSPATRIRNNFCYVLPSKPGFYGTIRKPNIHIVTFCFEIVKQKAPSLSRWGLDYLLSGQNLNSILSYRLNCSVERSEGANFNAIVVYSSGYDVGALC